LAVTDIYHDLKKYSFKALLRESLNAVSGEVDKREGSVIYDALAPLSMTMAKAIDALWQVLQQSRIQTAVEEHLDLCGSQVGVYRSPATAARWRATCLPASVAVPLGHVFVSSDGLGFTYEVIADQGEGVYLVQCTKPGREAGSDYGVLEPRPSIAGLESAVLTSCVDAGSDTQLDGAYRIKIWREAARKGYGGNFDDYCSWIFYGFREVGAEASVISGFQIYPSQATQSGDGGVVHLFVTQDTETERYAPASPEVVDALKGYLDPINVSGHGAGVVPCGHRVIIGVPARALMGLNIVVTCRPGYALDEAMQQNIINAALGYFEAMRRDALTNEGDDYPFGGYVAAFFVSGFSAAVIASDIARIASVTLFARGDGTYSEMQTDTEFVSMVDESVLPFLDELLIDGDVVFPSVE
jgi:uncharacterized phage protein gp47/JayE